MTRDEWIEHFQLDVVACATVDESYSSEVDRLVLTDGQVVFLKRPYTAEKWYRERGWIRALEGLVPVPRILAEAAPGQTTGAFVLAALPGQAPVSMTKKLAYEIGRTLAMLHTCTGEDYGEYTEDGFYAYPVQDWRRFRNEKLDGFMPFITSELDPVFLENIQTELVRREQSLPEPSRPVATHCDFRLANLLTVGDQVTGVIDFETTRYGAVEMDFTKIVRNLNTFGSIYVTAFQKDTRHYTQTCRSRRISHTIVCGKHSRPSAGASNGDEKSTRRSLRRTSHSSSRNYRRRAYRTGIDSPMSWKKPLYLEK